MVGYTYVTRFSDTGLFGNCWGVSFVFANQCCLMVLGRRGVAAMKNIIRGCSCSHDRGDGNGCVSYRLAQRKVFS